MSLYLGKHGPKKKKRKEKKKRIMLQTLLFTLFGLSVGRQISLVLEGLSSRQYLSPRLKGIRDGFIARRLKHSKWEMSTELSNFYHRSLLGGFLPAAPPLNRPCMTQGRFNGGVSLIISAKKWRLSIGMCICLWYFFSSCELIFAAILLHLLLTRCRDLFNEQKCKKKEEKKKRTKKRKRKNFELSRN